MQEVRAWTVEGVCTWTARLPLPPPRVQALRSADVDGAALLELTSDEVRDELKFPLGHRKALMRALAQLRAAPQQQARGPAELALADGKIWKAAAVGDVRGVERMLAALAPGFSIDTPSPFDRTMLHQACLCKQQRMVKWLLEHGARDDDGTAFLAIGSGEIRGLMRQHGFRGQNLVQSLRLRHFIAEFRLVLAKEGHGRLGVEAVAVFLDQDVISQVGALIWSRAVLAPRRTRQLMERFRSQRARGEPMQGGRAVRRCTLLQSTRKTSIMDSGMPSRSPSTTHRERIAEWLSGLGDRLEEEFARLDVNGDGQITREELLRSGQLQRDGLVDDDQTSTRVKTRRELLGVCVVLLNDYLSTSLVSLL